MKKILLSLMILYCISLSAVIKENEIEIFETMLNKVDLDLTALNFPKDWSSSDFKIPVISDILESPLKFPVFVDTLKAHFLKNDILFFHNYMTNILFDYSSEDDLQYFNHIDLKISHIKRPMDILKTAEYIMDLSVKYYRNAFDSLNAIEIDELKHFVYEMAKGGQIDTGRYNDLYQRKGFKNNDYEIEYYIDLIKKVNFVQLSRASDIYFYGMYSLANSDFSQLNFKRRTILKSPYGLLVCGTKNDDIYKDYYVFIYEPGGNDTYVSNMSTNTNHPFLTVIDMAGDDVYRNTEIGALFNIMFGIGFHYDKSGNDLYYGDDLSFSASFGMMISLDKQGNDQYISGSRSLGSAIFGTAYLVNQGGNDFYSSSIYSQGFGGTLGCGVLADYGSNNVWDNSDVYFAGGRYLHSPLAPDDFRSMSQGFGFGLRPDMAGGIGILFDENGNDFYNAGAYAQGSAYWLSLGILIDLSGNDSYNAVYYPQGSGIHLAGGFLYDESGDDSYYSRFGPGQGAGHDYGVGFLVDRSGNDVYSIDGGNGLGLTNSVGIFLDVKGNDRYERKRKDSYGFANTARNSGAIGLFLDLDGDDIYANENMADNSYWINGFYGIGLDTLTLKDDIVKQEKSEVNQLPLISSNASIEEVFAVASEWEVGSAVNRVRNAREILVSRDYEAVEYIFNDKLMTKSGLELRAITDLTKKSDFMKSKLTAGLNHKHFRAVNNTIYLIGEIEDLSFLDTFETMLDEDKNVNAILSALGKLKDEKSIDLLEKFIDSDDPYRKVITAGSLKNINSDRSIAVLMNLENDNCFLIQSMIRMMKD